MVISRKRINPGLIAEAQFRRSRQAAERGLYEFVRQGWGAIDSAPFQESWALEGLCLHLEAVTRGEIKRLLVNFPPRCGKTLVVSIFWPLWVWLQSERRVTSGPQVRWLCASYGDRLTLENAGKMRDLIASRWFQERWGDKIRLKADKTGQANYANTKRGARFSTSISGAMIGFGFDVGIVDDPHNTESVESDADREKALHGWREIASTRLNDPQNSAIVVIMQRLHEEDVSGSILAGEGADEWTVLILPMEYDPQRHCRTDLIVGYEKDEGEDRPVYWEDPRTEPGELLWPARFGQREVDGIRRELGPYMASGRLDQMPTPTGGGVISRDMWQLWPPRGEEALYTKTVFSQERNRNEERVVFPPFLYMLVALDGAYTEKEENDWSACTVWGVFEDRAKRQRVMMVEAWRERMHLHPLVMKVIDTCRRRNADMLLIEDKASGHSVAQEVRRLVRDGEWVTKLWTPLGDKMARLLATQPLFTDGLIYAPDREWAEMVIREVAMVPKGKHDDLADTVSSALQYLRKTGLINLRGEQEIIREDEQRFHGQTEPLYDV